MCCRKSEARPSFCNKFSKRYAFVLPLEANLIGCGRSRQRGLRCEQKGGGRCSLSSCSFERRKKLRCASGSSRASSCSNQWQTLRFSRRWSVSLFWRWLFIIIEDEREKKCSHSSGNRHLCLLIAWHQIVFINQKSGLTQLAAHFFVARQVLCWGWKTRSIALFNSFCSNVARRVARITVA